MIAIVGGGPTGLRAAEVAAEAGASVIVFDATPSVGRKFLVAGSGGLNLTKAEPPALFATRYRGGAAMPGDWWAARLAKFGPDDLRAWAAGLGVETFAATTGRVYPREMKAAPLLRAWVRRLRARGVAFAPRHRLTALDGCRLSFATPDGPRDFAADAVILALGGGSWPETGSDGAWTDLLCAAGVDVSPLAPANCGWEIPWPPALIAAAEGQPLKNIVARAGAEEAAGELLVTRYGLEGGALYALGAALRAMPCPELCLDLKPAVSAERLIARFGAPPARSLPAETLVREAAARWKLPPAAAALLQHHVPPAVDVPALAHLVKNLPLPPRGPRPLAEAISTAGGVAWSGVDPATLMLRLHPGVFVAGEMLDWEAPTGGYLLQGAFVTGAFAARAAVAFSRRD